MNCEICGVPLIIICNLYGMHVCVVCFERNRLLEVKNDTPR